MARLGRGRSLIGLGETQKGIALLDDAMVAVTSDELSPLVTGIVYCGSIEAFSEIFDLRRAQDWTQALADWTETQSDRLPFRGRCLVYRSSLMRLHGDWSTAFEEARRAEEWLLRPPPEPAVGEAYYEQAEVHRLRGDFAKAETAYREASRWGRRPEPGMALLLLARGRGDAARSMIERAVEEAADDIARVRLLPALAEIALAVGDPARAGEAVEGLMVAERARRAPLLEATVARLDGEVRLAAGDARAALDRLRAAERAWLAIDAPYDLAWVRADLGLVLLALGDAESATLEFDAALRTFLELHAEPAMRRVEQLARRPVGRPGGLSSREAEILNLVAAGNTNRAIAAALGISERTVDRHVSNIFAKLGSALALRRRRSRSNTTSPDAAVPNRSRHRIWVVPRMRASLFATCVFPGDRHAGRLRSDDEVGHDRRARTPYGNPDHRRRPGRPGRGLPPAEARAAVPRGRCRRADRRQLAEPLGLASAVQSGGGRRLAGDEPRRRQIASRPVARWPISSRRTPTASPSRS